MSGWVRGFTVAGLHVAFLLGIAGKYRYDRARLPCEWVRVMPVDPETPLRGRYLRLQTVDRKPPLQFEIFVPERAQIPSGLNRGEELWAEVNRLPDSSARAIQLSLRAHGTSRTLAAN